VVGGSELREFGKTERKGLFTRATAHDGGQGRPFFTHAFVKASHAESMLKEHHPDKVGGQEGE